ncbi:MAG: phosphotransferase [Proteobacteria bacterium]|nr:phosphotransferase [Pseudomonadota bacterium]
MLSDPLAVIDEGDRERARVALAAAFGRAPVTGLQPVAVGASALNFRIEVAGRPYMLRLEKARRDEVRDPPRAYACMQVAAAAGIAPAVRHADGAAGVSITDFVPARPLDSYDGGAPALLRDLGHLAARLQALPVFPAVRAYPDIVGSLLGLLIDSGRYAPDLLGPHRNGLARIREAWPRHAPPLVSSHNDLNPHNILFDGERLWLVDWETAYANDPLVDVATLLLFFARAPGQEEVLLEAWYGRPPDSRLADRLFLARLLVRLFFGCAATLNAARIGGPMAVETDLDAPTPEAFLVLLQRNGWAPGSAEAQRLVGKMALAGFLANLQSPRFEAALAG